MARRRRREPAPPNAVPHEPVALDWTIAETARINGRVLQPGVEASIRGERGRFRFVRCVSRPDGRCWLDFLGGVNGVSMYRSFRPDRVRNVHRIPTTRGNASKR